MPHGRVVDLARCCRSPGPELWCMRHNSQHDWPGLLLEAVLASISENYFLALRNVRYFYWSWWAWKWIARAQTRESACKNNNAVILQLFFLVYSCLSPCFLLHRRRFHRNHFSLFRLADLAREIFQLFFGVSREDGIVSGRGLWKLSYFNSSNYLHRCRRGSINLIGGCSTCSNAR